MTTVVMVETAEMVATEVMAEMVATEATVVMLEMVAMVVTAVKGVMPLNLPLPEVAMVVMAATGEIMVRRLSTDHKIKVEMAAMVVIQVKKENREK